MNRREFMAAIGAGGVVTASGLWMPGEKLISIPSGEVYTGGNRLLTPEMFVKESIRILKLEWGFDPPLRVRVPVEEFDEPCSVA